MNGIALLLAAATLGVDYGWQPSADGQLEYIIQIEPVTLIALREGQEVVSQIDPFAKNVRRFRLRLGTDLVPRRATAAQANAPAQPYVAVAPPSGVTYGWRPTETQGLEFIIQLAPERAATLRAGEDIVGQIPAEAPNVVRMRIRVGTDTLPRQAQPAAQPHAPAVPNDPNALPRRPGEVANTAAPPAISNATVTAPGAALVPGIAANAAGQPAPAGTGQYAPPPANGTIYAPDPNAGQNYVYPTQQPTNQPPRSDGWQPAAAQPYAQGAVAPQYAQGTVPLTQYAQGTQQYAAQQYAPQQYAPQPATTYANNLPPANQQPAWGPPYANQQPPAPNGYTAWGQPASPAYVDPNAPPRTTVPVPVYNSNPIQNQAQSPYVTAPSPGYSPFAVNDPSQGWVGSYESAQPTPVFSGSAAPNTGSYGEAESWPVPARTLTADKAKNEPDVWPFRKVGFEVESRQKAKPTDFWQSLADTSSDPSLAYLREGYSVGSVDPEQQWWPLTLAMFALFASLGGNLYMGWITVDIYRRYLDLTEDESRDGDYETDEEDEDRAGRRRRRDAVSV